MIVSPDTLLLKPNKQNPYWNGQILERRYLWYACTSSISVPKSTLSDCLFSRGDVRDA